MALIDLICNEEDCVNYDETLPSSYKLRTVNLLLDTNGNVDFCNEWQSK